MEPQPTGLDKEFRATVRPFLDAHCVSCHAHDKPKGGIDLGRFTSAAEVAADFPHWEAVFDQLKSQEMPPKTAKSQPTKDQRRAVMTWIESLRKNEAERNAGDPGVVLARRLSNAEYDYTVRDLTGVDIHPAREFPVDPANGAGFDNTGESLTMSPALATKYFAASRFVADHLLLLPEGFTFAPFPVLTDTDRDKFCVRRIVDFYQRQPTDLADYFRAAWEYRYRSELGRPNQSLTECARGAKVSPKYLEVVWPLLSEPADERGPIAAIRALWRALPKPADAQPEKLRRGCEKLRDVVLQLRGQVKVKVDNLTVSGMNRGAQALVLWKDREMAANRRHYGGGGLQLKAADPALGPDVAKALTVPAGEPERKRYEAAFERFCSVFPDAFYVSERGRVFLDPKEDRFNTGRLLSAGFHNQMGYFRDDQPLCELILDEADKRHLDKLWEEFDYASNVPARMHSGLIWFERSESPYLSGTEFDFARAEDKDVTSPDKLKRFVDMYMKKTKRSTSKEVVIKAVQDHFERSEANIRRVERAHETAEPGHVKALQDFAERAYRRRLTARERESVAGFYRSLRAEGLGHEDAVRDTLAGILMSPHFCFRVDLPVSTGTTTPGRTEALSDEALANRLSYFLWSSMPDRELLECAAKGTLHRPEVLVAQTRRMLRDDRARGLATQFGGSWLDFRRFDEHNAVDRGRFPQFDNELRQAMYEEPMRFLLDLIQNDRSVLDCLNGRHTFVNASLARHYGMPAPAGKGEWIRIEDATKYGRGGLLPMAVFATKNAPGLRTSPVKRGYWVVTRLLGEKIPAPPPNVPELPADEKKLGSLTLRETLARHREDMSCATCHARFDSFGLAFEGFGPIGERRTADLAGHAVDTRVSFPGGAEDDGISGLRGYLSERRRDDFLDNLCRKLLAYALGRSLMLSDDPTITAMRTRLSRDDYRFGGLIETIVTSPQFLTRRGPGEPKKEGPR
ncbi:DUF1592 domain-containing protein [Fimbriiglobus ruber]|uniref:DUF1592 domain-containing protein n=1 Tax=Fimbriiglobus ruber TaxID=1908690 RepID=UPI001930E480|nr:DUF1592 domain-containing protein [Fimbriiglobus ruber]